MLQQHQHCFSHAALLQPRRIASAMPHYVSHTADQNQNAA